MARDKTDKTDKTPAATLATTATRQERLTKLISAIHALPGAEKHHHIVLQAEAQLILKLAYNLAEEKALDRPASKRDTTKEIDRAIKLANDLAHHLENLHNPAFIALRNWGYDPAGIAENLREAASKATRPEVMETALSLASTKRGNPGDREAFILAFQSGRTYWKVTGDAPTISVNPIDSTASGHFLSFVAAVFEVFDATASAEGRARAAKDAIRKFHSN